MPSGGRRIRWIIGSWCNSRCVLEFYWVKQCTIWRRDSPKGVKSLKAHSTELQIETKCVTDEDVETLPDHTTATDKGLYEATGPTSYNSSTRSLFDV